MYYVSTAPHRDRDWLVCNETVAFRGKPGLYRRVTVFRQLLFIFCFLV